MKRRIAERWGAWLLVGALCAAALPAVAAPAASAPIPAGSTAAMLQAAVDGNWRPAADKARDPYRHPVQTLEFFGIKPDMTVIELTPGGGWYTRILAPFLYAHGHLIEPAAPAAAGKFASAMAQKFDALLASDPAVFGHVARGPAFNPFSAPHQLKLGPDDSADMVVTFRNMHDYLDAGTMAGVFRSVYAVLKPGGVFGITDNRAMPNADGRVTSRTLHRITEDLMIESGLQAGFKLAGVSEINANPKDPLNLLVFKMAPSFAHDTPAERAKLAPLGEPDAMTLKFVKP